MIDRQRAGETQRGHDPKEWGKMTSAYTTPYQKQTRYYTRTPPAYRTRTVHRPAIMTTKILHVTSHVPAANAQNLQSNEAALHRHKIP